MDTIILIALNLLSFAVFLALLPWVRKMIEKKPLSNVTTVSIIAEASVRGHLLASVQPPVYNEAIERQISNIERHIEVQLKAPVPQTKLQFADNGLEFMVRYPVNIRQASDIDDNITKAVLKVVNNESELKASVSGLPKIRAPIRG